jgi:hypothetical protein
LICAMHMLRVGRKRLQTSGLTIDCMDRIPTLTDREGLHLGVKLRLTIRKGSSQGSVTNPRCISRITLFDSWFTALQKPATPHMGGAALVSVAASVLGSFIFNTARSPPSRRERLKGSTSDTCVFSSAAGALPLRSCRIDQRLILGILIGEFVHIGPCVELLQRRHCGSRQLE